jgi:hypothetical protein
VELMNRLGYSRYGAVGNDPAELADLTGEAERELEMLQWFYEN